MNFIGFPKKTLANNVVYLRLFRKPILQLFFVLLRNIYIEIPEESFYGINNYLFENKTILKISY